ncbi:MAG TPA: hypothetical protein DEU22_07775 [Bacillus sp. (in: Bacteria)]|nr:hypothetical protein [Bacillus cereus]HCF32269.1 hypothetical protein [Bacillus sp. (in: firmicutes)]PEA06168.1 hypothetical protein CON37_02775 [Bacillus cereus]PFK68696.1 hypothetical protein COJ13_21130 [Bacillus cereus]PGX23133.1 hypothetical protein COE22_22380 [Bacillus cereus]
MILLDFELESYKTPSLKYILQMLPLISVISHKLSESFIFFVQFDIQRNNVFLKSLYPSIMKIWIIIYR